MNWLTWHFILGIITWACLAIGALVLLIIAAYVTIHLARAGWDRVRRHWRHAATVIAAPATRSISWREQAAVEAARRARAHLSTVPVSDDEWAEIVAVIEQAGTAE